MGTYDVIQDGRQVARVLNFSKAGNSEKNGPTKIKAFRCVLEHAYIKCIHFQLFMLKIWET